MEGSETIYHWSARRMPPRIIVYVALIFISFMALSYWGFHSLSAVKTLLFTAIGSVATLLPLLFNQIEYRLTQQSLESRPLSKKVTKPYKKMFSLNQLSYLVQTGSGFKFYLVLKEESRILRFWKKYISDNYSGEIKVEKKDFEEVIAAFERSGIEIKGK